MTPDRWKDISSMIEDKFEIIERYEEDLNPGKADIIEFVSPMGTMKISFSTRPKVLDKKTQYSNRVGGDIKVEYIYDPTQETSFLTVHKWDEDSDQWKKVDESSFL